MKYLFIKFTLLIVLVFVAFGCSESETPSGSKKPVKKAAAVKKVVPVAADEETKPVVKEYVYNPIGKRDPFENPLRAIIDIAPDSGVPLTPLQKFDIGQLRLIGVIIGKGSPRAMVIAPDGKSFILNVGTLIGKNEGSVINITTDAVLVKEKYYDFTGEIKTSIQEIRLPKQGGVK